MYREVFNFSFFLDCAKIKVVIKLKEKKGFNLLSVIIVICVTSIISGLTTGIIVTNSYKNNLGLTYEDLVNDESLNEFLEVYSSIINNYYEDVDKSAMIDSAVDGMLDYLGESYTTYLDEEQTAELEQKLKGSYRGVGIEITYDEDNTTNTITAVFPDSSAKRSGLQVGDIITGINGEDVTSKNNEEINTLIAGDADGKVSITVLRNNETLTYEVEIGDVSTGVMYEMKDNNIGYLEISLFPENLETQVRNALNTLNADGMQKLIIDLRGNTGGYLESAEATASLFLEKGQLIYSLQTKDATAEYYDKTDEHTTIPIVVLINGQSASAAEILAAALKDSYGAILVGEKSFGKGKVQQTYNLSDGSMAKYTSARWLRPNGSCIDGVGLIPDYIANMTVTYDENGEYNGTIDSQLNKAIEIISAM